MKGKKFVMVSSSVRKDANWYKSEKLGEGKRPEPKPVLGRYVEAPVEDEQTSYGSIISVDLTPSRRYVNLRVNSTKGISKNRVFAELGNI